VNIHAAANLKAILHLTLAGEKRCIPCTVITMFRGFTDLGRPAQHPVEESAINIKMCHLSGLDDWDEQTVQVREDGAKEMQRKQMGTWAAEDDELETATLLATMSQITIDTTVTVPAADDVAMTDADIAAPAPKAKAGGQRVETVETIAPPPKRMPIGHVSGPEAPPPEELPTPAMAVHLVAPLGMIQIPQPSGALAAEDKQAATVAAANRIHRELDAAQFTANTVEPKPADTANLVTTEKPKPKNDKTYAYQYQGGRGS